MEPVADRRDGGCLVAAVRLPVRLVALVVVLPLRMLWDLAVVAGRSVRTAVLAPLWRGFVRAVTWLGRALLVTPARWLYRWVLAPAGRGAAWVLRGTGAGLARILGGVWRVLRGTGRGVAVAVVRLVRWLLLAPAVLAYRWALTPVGHALRWLGHRFLDGARWLYRRALTPLGHAGRRLARGAWAVLRALGAAVAWLVRWLVVAPAVALHRWVLEPLGRGVARTLRRAAAVVGRLLRWLVVAPLAAVGRVLAVVAREAGEALGHAWRIAGRISLVLGRFLATLLRWIFVEPVRLAFRAVLAPAGRFVRDAVLRPVGRVVRETGRAVGNALAAARVTAREVRRELRTALFGAPREAPVRAGAADRRELGGPEARTLGSSTTALTKD
ncbi:hypothetical protein [Streptomyces chilikensis]|uniref:hypothetical protein n=1 Tax=Streptomyces chilikensis TaxID=1194079 RepID=UPI001F0FE7DA|nr:hypothetical protein [Streptomyces chilikensis]